MKYLFFVGAFFWCIVPHIFKMIWFSIKLNYKSTLELSEDTMERINEYYKKNK